MTQKNSSRINLEDTKALFPKFCFALHNQVFTIDCIMVYSEIKDAVLKLLNDTKLVVLATANRNGVVATAQVLIVNDGLKAYIMTDKKFEKALNISENPCVALSIGAFSFKGLARILGHPLKFKNIANKIKEKHLDSYNTYINIADEVLIEVRLTEARIWNLGNKDNKTKIIRKVDFEKEKAETINCDMN